MTIPPLKFTWVGNGWNEYGIVDEWEVDEWVVDEWVVDECTGR